MTYQSNGYVSRIGYKQQFAAGGPSILDSAVNYWAMEETGTNDRVDSIGTDDLTPDEAITSITGINGDADNYDADTHIMTSTAWRAVGWTGFTISAWLMRDAMPSGNAWFFTEDTGSNPSVLGYIRNDGEATAVVRNNAVSVGLASTGAFNTDVDTEWTHWCLSWNADDNVRLFIQGVQRGVSAGALSGTLLNNAVGLTFGASGTGSNPWARSPGEGYLDEVAIFDYGIGEAGALELYNGGAGRFL